MKPTTLLAFMSVLAASALPAQDRGRPAVASDSVPATVADAEAEGGRYPRSPEKPAYAIWFDTVTHVGTSDRRCVNVGTEEVVRSGDMFAGPFADAVRSSRMKEAKFWLQPTHRPTPGVPMTFALRATRLDTTSVGWVRASEPFTLQSAVLTAVSMPIGLWLPSSGVWMLIATAGEDWGCFVVIW
jgi:hypothetical protein